jgi:hypothetical protein
MATGSQSRGDDEMESDGPTVSVCESRPGRTVFIESGNTDGWIASDLTVDATR